MNKQYRVYNKCKYDIGLQLANGQQCNITPNSFRLLTADDILFVESICYNTKFFSQRMLVPVDPETNKEVSLQDVGGYTDQTLTKHMNDEQIVANLKQNNKKIEAWLQTITDAAQLHAVFQVAKTMDLTASKLKLLQNYMPQKNLLEQ